MKTLQIMKTKQYLVVIYVIKYIIHHATTVEQFMKNIVKISL